MHCGYRRIGGLGQVGSSFEAKVRGLRALQHLRGVPWGLLDQLLGGRRSTVRDERWVERFGVRWKKISNV